MESQVPDTPTVEPTTLESESARLREEWAEFSESKRYVIKAIAEKFLFGHWQDGTPITREHDGVHLPITLAELINEEMSGSLDRNSPNTLAHVQRYVDWLDQNRRRERANRFFHKLGPRHGESWLTNYKASCPEQEAVLDACRDYARNMHDRVKAGSGIIANGRVGTGKTHLLIGLARIAFREGFTVAYENGQKLISDFRSRMDNKAGPSEKKMLAALIEPEILILDDPVPPHSELTSYQEQLLYIIADGRYNAMRPTWVAMNVESTEDAQKRIGAAILDRWKHNALTLAFNWPSHRQAGSFEK